VGFEVTVQHTGRVDLAQATIPAGPGSTARCGAVFSGLKQFRAPATPGMPRRPRAGRTEGPASGRRPQWRMPTICAGQPRGAGHRLRKKYAVLPMRCTVWRPRDPRAALWIRDMAPPGSSGRKPTANGHYEEETVTAVYTVFAVEGGSALVLASLLAVWAGRRFTPRVAVAATETSPTTASVTE
jgi:hypothetical protein